MQGFNSKSGAIISCFYVSIDGQCCVFQFQKWCNYIKDAEGKNKTFMSSFNSKSGAIISQFSWHYQRHQLSFNSKSGAIISHHRRGNHNPRRSFNSKSGAIISCILLGILYSIGMFQFQKWCNYIRRILRRAQLQFSVSIPKVVQLYLFKNQTSDSPSTSFNSKSGAIISTTIKLKHYVTESFNSKSGAIISVYQTNPRWHPMLFQFQKWCNYIVVILVFW